MLSPYQRKSTKSMLQKAPGETKYEEQTKVKQRHLFLMQRPHLVRKWMFER